MENYFTSALPVRLEDYQNDNNQNPSRILLNPLALSFIDRTVTRPHNVSVSSNIARVTLMTLLLTAC